MWNYLKPYQSYRADTISIPKITKGNNSAKNMGGVNLVNLCTSSGHVLYFYQVLWNYFERYQSYSADTIFILKISKGNNSAKNVGGINVVNLCTSSGHALYLCQVSWNYLERYQSYRVDTISIPKITKGNNSTKNVGGVTVFHLCTSSGHALYFYQVLWNYLKLYQSYRADTISILLYISTKFCEIISNGIKVIERTRFLYWKFQRGIIPQKMWVEWQLLISARRLIMVYICAKFREIISDSIKVMERTRMFNRWQTDGRTDTQKFGGHNIIPRHFLWRA